MYSKPSTEKQGFSEILEKYLGVDLNSKAAQMMLRSFKLISSHRNKVGKDWLIRVDTNLDK